MTESGAGGKARLHASLALLPFDDSQVGYLLDRMLTAEPAELPVLRTSLAPHRSRLLPRLWPVLESANPDDARLLPAAGALALYDPENPLWVEAGDKVARALVSVNPVYLGRWLDTLRPVRRKLTPPLVAILRDGKRTESEVLQATNIVADYADDDLNLLVSLLLDSEKRPFALLFEKVKDRRTLAVPLLEAEIARKPAPMRPPTPGMSWPAGGRTREWPCCGYGSSGRSGRYSG